MKFKQWLPLILIGLLMLLAYVSGLHSYLSLETLRTYREQLQSWVAEAPVASAASYTAAYVLIVALSIPGAALASLMGGFLFPQPLATLYVVTGATIGACTIFAAARTALGESLRRKAGPTLQRMEAGFHENAASYLLFLRLVPLFPFWLVNLAPALFGVQFRTFAWTTFLGILPGAFVFTQAGAGLGGILDSGEELSIAALLNPQMRIALVALGVFALLPVLLKRWRR